MNIFDRLNIEIDKLNPLPSLKGPRILKLKINIPIEDGEDPEALAGIIKTLLGLQKDLEYTDTGVTITSHQLPTAIKYRDRLFSSIANSKWDDLFELLGNRKCLDIGTKKIVKRYSAAIPYTLTACNEFYNILKNDTNINGKRLAQLDKSYETTVKRLHEYIEKRHVSINTQIALTQNPPAEKTPKKPDDETSDQEPPPVDKTPGKPVETPGQVPPPVDKTPTKSVEGPGFSPLFNSGGKRRISFLQITEEVNKANNLKRRKLNSDDKNSKLDAKIEAKFENLSAENTALTTDIETLESEIKLLKDFMGPRQTAQ